MDIQKLAQFLYINGEKFKKKLKRENSFCNGIKWNRIFKNIFNLEVKTHTLQTTNNDERKKRRNRWVKMHPVSKD